MTTNEKRPHKAIWIPLSIWAVIIGAALYFAPQLPSKLQAGNMLSPGTESDFVRKIVLNELDENSSSSLFLAIQAKDILVTDSAYENALTHIKNLIMQINGVDDVTDYWTVKDKRFIGKDGKTTFLVIKTDATSTKIQEDIIPAIRKIKATLPSNFNAHLTGEYPIASDIYYESIQAVNSSDIIAIPIILLVLLIIFRSVVASLVPLGLGLISIVISLAAYYFYAHFFHGDTMAPAIISMLGLGVGIDYSLFIVTRFREELAAGLSQFAAARRTARTAGRAVLFSGITVLVSVASLLIVENPLFRSLAVSMMLVVLVSMLVATTLLPVVLALLGTKINSWPVPFFSQKKERPLGTFWHRWAIAVMKRPILFAILSLVPLLAFAYPVKNLTTGWPNVNLLSAEADSRLGYESMVAQFGEGELQSIDLIAQVNTGTVAGEQNLESLYNLGNEIKKDPSVISVLSFTSLREDLDLAAYKEMYIDAPVKLVTLPLHLGKVGKGLDEAVAGLEKIRAGLNEIITKISSKVGQSPQELAAVSKQFAQISTELTEVSQSLVRSDFASKNSAIKTTAEGARLLKFAADGIESMSDENQAKSIAELKTALQSMADALGQIIPGLSSVSARLNDISKKVAGANLNQAAERGDFGLRLVASSASKHEAQALKMLVNLNGAANIARFRIVPAQGADSEDTKALVHRLRNLNNEFTQTHGTIKVGGISAAMMDYNDQIRWALPRVIGLVMVITFFVMLILLKSILLPIKAIIMNSLSVLAAYGVMVLVFQEGFLSSFLGFTPLGYVGAPTILMLFAVLFGLSMDYEVFLLSRIKEAHDRDGNNSNAVALGLEQTAGIITGAALIMLVVFGTFLVNGIITIKEFGVGLFTAVLLDATLIRIILVPAFMRLFGSWNWWAPKWMLKILNKISVEEK